MALAFFDARGEEAKLKPALRIAAASAWALSIRCLSAAAIGATTYTRGYVRGQMKENGARTGQES